MMNKDSHIIDLSTLELGHYQFDFQLNNDYFATLEKIDLLGGNVDAKALLDLRAEDFSLTISVHGIVQVICDRCLDPMDISVDAEEEVDMEDEGIEIDKIKTIDLQWLAYELVILHLPLIHSHQEGGCNPQMDALLHDHLCETTEDNTIQQDE